MMMMKSMDGGKYIYNNMERYAGVKEKKIRRRRNETPPTKQNKTTNTSSEKKYADFIYQFGIILNIK